MKLFFFIPTLLFPFLLLAEGSLRASHGETCDRTKRCDSRSFLTCKDGKCECMMPDSMLFDESSKKCTALAGERCLYTAIEGEATWSDKVPCLPEAECTNGVCECSSYYFELSNGTCSSKHDYQETCANNNMCRSDRNLVCNNDGKCDCKADRLFDPFRNGCVKKAGMDCSGGEICVDNAECQKSPKWHCKCKDQHFQTSNGTCQRKSSFGGICNDDNQCESVSEWRRVSDNNPMKVSSNLVCKTGRCHCNETASIVNTKTTEPMPACLFRPGETCQYSPRTEECAIGSYCKEEQYYDNGYRIRRTCTCDNNSYLQNKNISKSCEPKKSHGGVCTHTNECKGNYVTCDLFTHTCECTARKAYHPTRRECVSAADSPCDNSLQCIPNANCQYKPGYGNVCTCINNTTPFGKYCYIGDGKSCEKDIYGELDSCAPGLVCRNQTCSCNYKDHQLYQENKRECVSLLNGPCDDRVSCIDNAECVLNCGFQFCQCKSGFTPVDRVCDLAYGEECTQNANSTKCDRLAPLECSARGICECSDFQIYSDDDLKCKGLVGAKCEVSSKNFCVFGATCKTFRSSNLKTGICMCDKGLYVQADRSCNSTETTTTTTEKILINESLIETNDPVFANLPLEDVYQDHSHNDED